MKLLWLYRIPVYVYSVRKYSMYSYISFCMCESSTAVSTYTGGAFRVGERRDAEGHLPTLLFTPPPLPSLSLGKLLSLNYTIRIQLSLTPVEETSKCSTVVYTIIEHSMHSCNCTLHGSLVQHHVHRPQ